MSKRITRTEANFCLDATLLSLFVALATCSVIVEFVFPPGPQADGWLLWSWTYVAWRRLQFGLLATLAAALLLHVMLHWSWVCGVIASRLGRKKPGHAAVKDDPSRTLWGVGLLIVLINLVGLVVAAAALSVQAPTPDY